MRVAALDLGTNTFLLLIAEVENGEIRQVLHDEVRVIRLGQGVGESRLFHVEALERAEIAFQDYAAIIRKFQPSKVLACATSAARDVHNKQALFDIAARAGIPLEIISGEREAELTFFGTLKPQSKSEESTPKSAASPAISGHTQIVIDVGGGSTEFILGDGRGIRVRKSYDVGAVRLTESLITQHPISQKEKIQMWEVINHKFLDIRRVFEVDASEMHSRNVIAVAGTPTTLAALDLQQSFNAEKIEGYVLTRVQIQNWIDRLSPMTIDQRSQLAGMEPKRADVIVAGAMILAAACDKLAATSVEVSTRGLRFGIAKSLS